MLTKQKLEFTDFSAGITENTVPGKMNAYAGADNLLITKDKHLDSRGGSQGLGENSYYMTPTGFYRISGLIAFNDDADLFGIAYKSLCWKEDTATAAWQELLGPEGGNAFAHNGLDSKVAYAEWHDHLYLVPDGGDGPQMIYRDQVDLLQLRQAGLPRPAFAPAYTETQLLAAAIGLALDVRGFMLTHYGDTVAHLTAHAAAVTALSALVTPVTLADLITYIGALKTQYDLHITDAQSADFVQVYHIQISNPTHEASLGRYAVLNLLSDTSLVTPTTLALAVSTLNDLRNRYNLHTYATITHKDAVSSLSAQNAFTGHAYATDNTGYGKNKCTTPALNVNTVVTTNLTYYTPVFSGGLGVYLAYLNRIKSEFNTHLQDAAGGGFGSHNNVDLFNQIPVADATDFETATVILAHLEFFYWWHYKDASQTEDGVALDMVSFTGTATIGSASMTSTSINGSSYVGYYLIKIEGASSWIDWTQDDLFAPLTKVSSGTGTTVVFNNVSLAASGAGTYRIGQSEFHFDLDLSGGSETSPAAYNRRVQALDYSYTNLTTLIDSTVFILGLLKTHELSSWHLDDSNGNPVYLMDSGQTVDRFSTHYSNPASPAFWPESNPGMVFVDKTTDALYLDSPPVPGSVLYTVVWRYTYQAGLLTFEDRSTPAQLSQLYVFPSPAQTVPLTGALYPITLSDLPVLANELGENWDTANIYLEIYRTITNGTTLFKVGEVLNGTTTFSDTVVDADLITNQPLYTTGGVLGNDEPPKSRFITILNNTAYYGYVTDITSGETFANRVLQSIPSAPGAVPASNFDDLDDRLTGLSNFNSYVLAFCRNRFYRLEGQFNELGQGAITHQSVSTTVGCVAHSSIVQTEFGVFFCGTNGVYWTDGYNFTRINGELERTYNSYIVSPTQRARITGVYDKLTRRIYWTFSTTPTNPEADIAWVLDLNWGMSEKASFTTMSAGLDFSPSALAFYRGQLIRGTGYGYLFAHSVDYLSDQIPVKFSAVTDPADWLPAAVIYTYESCATDFGSTAVKKWVTRLTYQGKILSNLSLQPSQQTDHARAGFRPLVPIRGRPLPVWGDPTLLWGDDDCIWDEQGMYDVFRRMTAGSLRCDWKAVRFTNADVIVANSDHNGGTGTAGALGAGSFSFTLTTPAGWQFPLWAVLYTIGFDTVDGDGVSNGNQYVTQYAISVRTDTVLTVLDPGNTAPHAQAGVKWEIRGIPVNERFNLTSFNLTYAPLADEQQAYHGATSSDGGQNK